MGRIQRLVRQVDMWVNGVGLILVYHRVAKVGCDPWGLCVSPENFAEQLQVLREFGPCMTVGEMVRRLHAGQLPRRAVAVSFDDGYADNLHTALPLLEQHGVPATFFLSAGLLDGVSEFWWDELERILLHPSTLPEELELDVAGLTFRRQLGAGVTLSDGDYLLHRRWLYTEPPPTERHVLYLELWSLLRPLPHNHRAGLLARLASWAGAGVEPRESHRPMSAEEACSLGRNGLVEIGAHTMTHPLLPALSKERQRNEISKSKSTSEAIWGRPVESFSYPHGGFSGLTADLVRAEGFASACTSRHGPAGNRNDRFQLPRFTVGDWSGAELEARLEQWV